MRIGIIGAGSIGAALARLWLASGHEIVVSYSRNPERLQLPNAVRTGSPADAAIFGDVVVLSVPWSQIDDALAQAGSVDGKIVIDTTNQFGPQGLIRLPGISAAHYNASRAPSARWVKTFNSIPVAALTSASRNHEQERYGMFVAADDDNAKAVVEPLVHDTGFTAIDMGSLHRNEVGHIEPTGELFGRALREQEARMYAEKLRGTTPKV